ncbi:protein of unknown function [Methylorubrum extorquens]|uniref:Uncharacterized protein n=1 Tax=Methylorubrum extorquens TaxID=408 RepID=A0A2N9AS93_METEX|nr:protein of unknown function [Methylorubrum extorquens]
MLGRASFSADGHRREMAEPKSLFRPVLASGAEIPSDRRLEEARSASMPAVTAFHIRRPDPT